MQPAGIDLIEYVPIDTIDLDEKALKELERGEKTASALENQLSSIEKKIDDLLAQTDHDESKLAMSAQPNDAGKSLEESNKREDHK